MRPLHLSFLEEVSKQRNAIQTRRTLLARGGALAAMGTVGVTAGSAGLFRAASPVLAQDFTDDLDILNYALTLEHLETAFYRDGLAMFDEAEVADATMSDTAFAWLTAIGEHEAAHVEALVSTITSLSGTPVEEASYDFGVTDFQSFLDTAAALETTGVAAYAGAAPSIKNADILAAALGIHSVEARHAAYVNGLLATSPFPDAVDTALSREDVLAAAGGFIVSDATSSTPATTTEGKTIEVRIKDYKFVPPTVDVAAGDSVSWINDDIVPHTATANDGSFDSGSMDKDDVFTQKFDAAGSIPYICAIHTSMIGTVNVK